MGRDTPLMAMVSDWLPPAIVGVTFLTVALLKVYGFRKGVVGGGDEPAMCRLLGRCPSWSLRANHAMVILFFAIGVGNLIYVACTLMRR